MKKILTLFTVLLLLGSFTVVKAYTFPSGTKIYYNLTEYGGGINPYAPGSNNWEASTANIIEVTLNSNWTVNAGTKLFKSGAGGNWADRSCSSAPTAGQNMIISTDGINVTWGTYVEPTLENYTIYFKNNPGWSTVYIHLYGSGTTFGGNGVGGNGAAVNATMTKIDAGPYWKYEYSSVVKYTKVCFTKEAQNNYNDFWNNECSWSDGLDFDNNKVLWIPNTASSTSKNNCTYYNAGAWSEYPPVSPIVSFSGLPATVGVGQQVTFAATSENVSNPTYTFYVKKGSGSYGSAVTSYTFASADTYTIKVEVRSNGTGSALDTKEATITCNPSYTVYFKNTPGWTNVYAHLYPSGQTFGDNGVGGQSAEINAAMTKIDDGPYWKLEYNSATKYTKVCFTKDFQDGYENFHVNECSWSTGLNFDNNLVLWIPSTASSSSINSCTYYNTGEWSVYPPLVPGVTFSGVPTNVFYGQQVTFAATSENVNNPTYTYQIKIGEGQYAAAANPYTFNAAGSYTVKVEVRSNGAGEVLASAEQAITCLKYSLMQNNHESNNKGSEVAICSSTDGTTFTASWTCPSAGTYYFYATKNVSATTASTNNQCDYLNADQTLADGVNKQAYLYGGHEAYNHSFTLNAPRAGQYTFTLTLGDPIYFKCDYPEALDAEVDLDALPSIAYKDDAFTLASYVNSVNVVQPEYTFFVKKGDAAYGSAVTSYTFAETGTYTVKAEVREQGAGGDALDDVEKSITIYEEPLTLYFVNKEGWSDIHAYVYGDGDIKNAPWPGELMTATGDETDRNHYAVYSVVVPKDIYTTAIFNNSESGFPDNQTGNMTIDNTKPYYYDGDWYATLAECDQPVLTTHYYLVGSFNSWNTTADRFMKATEDATTASVTISVSEYSDIEFKVIDNGSWCGAASAVTLDKDHNTITIPTTDGSNFGLTPYAAGDYIFTLDLSTRELTVTYPSGDPMPVPTNFYLAGTFNGWSTTADRFVKASPDATTASVTINIAEYINITMKVMEGSAYCGGATAIDKDNTSVTIAAAGQGNDIAMTPYAAGDYIFTFDLSTRELTVTYPSGDPMPIPQNIYLLGIESWDESDDYKFSVSGDVATLEVENMTALHEYEFKLKYNGAWFGANYDFKYYWCSDVVFSAGADNAKLYTFKDGTYTFTLKISTMELTIGFPPTAATSVSVSQYEYATLYSDKALDVPNEVEAFVVTGHEGIRLTLEPIYRIPANTGVLLHAPQGTYNFYEGDARWIDPVATNYLKGSVDDELIDNSLIHYVLSYNNDFQVGFYWPFGTGATQGVGAFTNNAGKAYLELLSQPASVIAIQGFTFVNTTDSTTGLEDVTTEGESVKVLRNGMLLIIRNGQVFNAQGARVQ